MWAERMPAHACSPASRKSKLEDFILLYVRIRIGLGEIKSQKTSQYCYVWPHVTYLSYNMLYANEYVYMYMITEMQEEIFVSNGLNMKQ